jgi:hypothetical protein
MLNNIPIKVLLINATNDTVKETLVFIGNVSKSILHECESLCKNKIHTGKHNSAVLTEHYGKNYKEILAIGPNTRYISSPMIFPIDNFETIREKISLITEIPLYRQHIMYYDNEIPKTTYNVELNGLSISVNIRNASKYTKTPLFDTIPLDKRFHMINVVQNIIPQETTTDQDVIGAYDEETAQLINKYDGEEIERDVFYGETEPMCEEDFIVKDNHKKGASDKQSIGEINVIIEPLDQFKLIGLESIDNNTLYVADINDFILPKYKKDILADNYYLNLVYASFVVKYFPRFSLDSFKDYLKNEAVFREQYTELSINKYVLESQYEAENEFLNYMYKNKVATMTWAKDNTKNYLTKITAYAHPIIAQLNIRNLFDLLELDGLISEIRAKIGNHGRNYLLRKNQINAPNIKFPSEYEFSQDMVMAIKNKRVGIKEGEKERYIFLCVRSNAKIFISCEWDEYDDIDITKASKIIADVVNKIIKKINVLGKYAIIGGKQLLEIEPSQVVLKNVESYLLWKKSISNFSYKLFTKKLEELLVSKILLLKQATKTEKVEEYLIAKGAYNFDRDLIHRILDRINIEVYNLYSYFSNPTINKKWKQIYSGRDLQVSHKTTAIEFRVNSIGQNEFDIFQMIIHAFLYKTSKCPDLVEQVNSSTSFYKARKLRQEDPVLYDLGRYEGQTQMYSRLCQQIKQPTIYTEDEIKNMNPKKLTKYWNFTTKSPAYYSCNNKSFTEMSFIVDKHPMGYCMPCCTKKMNRREDSLKAIKVAKCLQDHTFSGIEKTSKHIVEFGKQIEDGRLANLPNTLSRLFFGASGDNDLYLYGINQYYANQYAPILNIASLVLKIKQVNILNDILPIIADKKIFATLLEGGISAYFTSADELVAVYTEIFLLGKTSNSEFSSWNLIFTELIIICYSLEISLFTATSTPSNSADKFKDIKLTQMKTSIKRDLSAPIRHIILVENNKMSMNPLFQFGKKKHSIERMLYTGTDVMIERITRILGKENSFDYSGYEIEAQYVNKSGLCYAYILKNKSSGEFVYVPVSYLTIKGDIKAIYDSFGSHTSEYVLKLSTLLEFLKNEHIIRFITRDNNVIGVETRNGVHYCDCSVVNENNVSKNINSKEITYNPHEVNKAIIDNVAANDKDMKAKLGRAIYVNYQYRLFVMEFANYIDKERNEELRAQIYEIIEKTNLLKPIKQLKKQLEELLPQDTFVPILKEVNRAHYKWSNKAQVLSQIKNTTYSFDRKAMAHLIEMERYELLEELKKISTNFAVEMELKGGDFPNIYMICENTDAIYCDNGRLIVKSLDEMVRFLADDLKNELKRQYFLTDIWIENYIDYFSFKQQANTKVSILSII